MPFASANMAEFWRRWHISLSTWIRDYVFIPLGGSRGGRWLSYRNTLIAFTLCGLWHGANWNYVAWGFLNGVLLVVHAWFRPWCTRRPALEAALRSGSGTAVRVAITFACFCLTLAVFRTQGLAAAGVMLRGMLTPVAGPGLTLHTHGLYLTFAFVILCHVMALRNWWPRIYERLPLPARGLGFGAALTLALILMPGASKAFIYFQF
jgi:hypothetical protein